MKDMATPLLKLVPKQTTEARTSLLTQHKLAELMHLVDQAQLTVNEAWDRVVMTTDSYGEADQMAILDYEMAMTDLLEANRRAGLVKNEEYIGREGVLGEIGGG
jgi:hypothetical protein